MDANSNQLNAPAADDDASPWVTRPADWFVRQLGLPWPAAGRPADADQPVADQPRADQTSAYRPSAYRPSAYRPSAGQPSAGQPSAVEDDRFDQPFVPSAANPAPPEPAPGEPDSPLAADLAGWHVPEPRWTYADIAWEKLDTGSADRWSDDRPPIWPRPADLAGPPETGAAERTSAGDTLLLDRPVPGGPGRPGRRQPRRQPVRRQPRRRPRRPMVGVVLPAVLLTTVAAVAIALLTSSGPRAGSLAGDEQASGAATVPAAAGFDLYPGQQQRGVVQSITRVVTVGRTIVATGSQLSDGVVRPQFLVSADGGASWRLAPVEAPGGGTAALGHPATLLAGGAGGWAAVGPDAVWTSRTGLAWTLAAAHGISPQLPGDSVWVITATADGFLAAGANGKLGQAVVWTSPDGVRWQRATAAQLGLAGPGETVLNVSHAATHGTATVISGTVTRAGTSYDAAWLGTPGRTGWTRITIPAGPGTGPVITGLGADRAGLLAVRPGRAADGAAEAVAYFSADGLDWQYAATIGADGGWSPGVVKGSDYGLVVTGTGASGQLTSYTSDGAGTAWQETGSLGQQAAGSLDGATVAPDGAVIAVGHTAPGAAGQQGVLLTAGADGTVRSTSLARVPGATVPELQVNASAAADGERIAVGSADGYPAIWRNRGGSRWTLVSAPAAGGAGGGVRALTSVTHGPAGWLAVGEPGPVVLTSADGTRWVAAAGAAADLAGVSAVTAAAGPAGYVIAGPLAAPGGGSVPDVWWSPDLTSWTRAHDAAGAGGSGQVLAVAAGPHGFVSVGSRGGQPAVWTTGDGRSWDTTVLPGPGGAGTAVLRQVAINGHNVVALGQAGAVPFAEFSADDGRTWRRVPFGSASPGTTVTALTASPAGFTAGGLTSQGRAAIWTSGSGATWTPSSAAGVGGSAAWQVDALAPDGPATSGIGTVVTARGQQIVTFTTRP